MTKVITKITITRSPKSSPSPGHQNHHQNHQVTKTITKITRSLKSSPKSPGHQNHHQNHQVTKIITTITRSPRSPGHQNHHQNHQVTPPIWVHSEPLPHWPTSYDGGRLCWGEDQHHQHLISNPQCIQHCICIWNQLTVAFGFVINCRCWWFHEVFCFKD